MNKRLIPWFPKKSISKIQEAPSAITSKNNLTRKIYSSEVDRVQTDAPLRHTPEDCQHEWLEVIGELFLLCEGCGNYGASQRVLLSRKEAKQLRKSGAHAGTNFSMETSSKLRLRK